MRSVAYILGLNYIDDPIIQLHNSWNDAISMGSYLVSEGFLVDDVHVVMDNTHKGVRLTSKSEIMSCLDTFTTYSWLYNLESFVFSFSGHGTNHSLYSSDHRALQSSELLDLFKMFNPKTHIYCVIDCSSHIFKFEYTFPRQNDCQSRDVITIDRKITCVSCCKDILNTSDMCKVCRFGGILTMILLMSMNQHKGNSKIQLIYFEMLANMRELGIRIEVLFSSTRPILSDTRFIFD